MIQVTATGEEHGLLGTLPNAVPFTDFKNYKPEMRERLRKEQKEDSRMVKTRYINHPEGVLGRCSKTYVRYAGEPLMRYHLIHDYEYTLPLGFVNEINESRTTVREGLQSVDGKDVNNGAPLAKDAYVRCHELVPVKF